ncbi:MAG: hypothetical protein ACPGTQ_04615 [Colwellia sp.]
MGRTIRQKSTKKRTCTITAIKRKLSKVILFSSICSFTAFLNAAPFSEDKFNESFSQFNQQSQQTFNHFSQANEQAFNHAFVAQWQTFNQALTKQKPRKPKPSIQTRALINQVSATENQTNSTLNTSNTSPATYKHIKPPTSASQTFFGYPLLNLPLTTLPKLKGTSKKQLLEFRTRALSNSDFIELYALLGFMVQKTQADSFVQQQLALTLCKQFYLLKNAQIGCAWVLLQQQGFDARLGVQELNNAKATQLLLLLPSKQTWYAHAYFELEQQHFYVINQKDYYRIENQDTHIQTAQHLQATNIVRSKLSQGFKPPGKNKITVKKWQTAFSLDIDHLAYLNTLPVLSTETYLQDIPPPNLSKQINAWLIAQAPAQAPAQTKVQRINQWLSLLQYLPYQIDDTQFGKERPLTLSELLYYPYSDCEDRVYALAYFNQVIPQGRFSALEYPNHLSGAFKLKNAWVEADPTYQGASLGMTQPAYEKIQPTFYPIP